MFFDPLDENAMRLLALPICVAVIAAIACSRADGGNQKAEAPTGVVATVHGDIYLVMKSGDTKRGSGRTVFLIRDSDSLQAAIGAICETSLAHLKQRRSQLAALADSLNTFPTFVGLLGRHAQTIVDASKRETSAAIDAIDRLIVGQVLDTTSAGVEARYRFARVSSGRYFIFSPWDIGDHRYRFVAPLVVTTGDTLRRDLDNSVESSDKLYCGLPSSRL
jgi:hypothetical protein